jgi:hypothetical protein
MNHNLNPQTTRECIVLIFIEFFGDKYLHNKLGKDVETDDDVPLSNIESGKIINISNKYSTMIKLEKSYLIEKNENNKIKMNIINTNRNINAPIFNNLEQSLDYRGTAFDLKELLDTYELKI